MDAVTYPQPSIERYINEQFIPVKVNILSGDPKQVAHLHSVWTPAFLLLDKSREYARRYGFLPPEEFAAWLRLAQGDRALARGRYDEAAAMFTEAAENFSQSAFTPRALYFEGVARYKQSGDGSALHSSWEKLARGYPESEWGRAVSWAVNPATK